jgi:hypothetical protein
MRSLQRAFKCIKSALPHEIDSSKTLTVLSRPSDPTTSEPLSFISTKRDEIYPTKIQPHLTWSELSKHTHQIPHFPPDP